MSGIASQDRISNSIRLAKRGTDKIFQWFKRLFTAMPNFLKRDLTDGGAHALNSEQIAAIRDKRRETQCPFKDVDAQRTDLSYANWSNEDFSACDLRGANLSYCNFSGANLRNSVLWDADLTESDLSQAKNLLPVQLAGTDLTRAKLSDQLGRFEAIESVKALSETSSKTFLTILLAVFYTLLALANTKDSQLVTNSGNAYKLPIVNLEIPIVGFYLVTPVILLALYLHFHFYLQRLWETTVNLPAVFPDGRRVDEKTPAWLMNDLARSYIPRVRRVGVSLIFPQRIFLFLLGYWLVPGTLILLWARFLRAEIDWITIIQSLIIALSLTSAVLFSRLTRATLSGKGFHSPRNSPNYFAAC